MTACLHHVILQRLLQPRCSTRRTSARRTRDKRGGRRERREGVTPQGTNKEGWVHECQPIRVKSPFTSKPVLHRFTPATVSVHFMFAVNADCFFFFLHIRDIPLLKWMYSEHHREEECKSWRRRLSICNMSLLLYSTGYSNFETLTGHKGHTRHTTNYGRLRSIKQSLGLVEANNILI